MAGAVSAVPLNEFCVSRTLAISPVYDGLKGFMEMRTDPATDPDVGYVHVAQADVGQYDGDFVAIGTYKGKAPPGCANDFDARWSGYLDGEFLALYFCQSFAPDAYGVGDKPSFKIEFTTCPFDPELQAWVLSLPGNSPRACVEGPTAARGLYIGLETASNPADPADRNIDVKYTILYRNQTNGATWVELGTPPPSANQCDPNYAYTIVSSTQHNFFLPPMN